MEGVKLFEGSNIPLLFQNERLHCPSDLVDPLWLHGSRSLVNLENVSSGNNRAFFQSIEKEEKVDDEDYESCFHHQGKKRRLTTEQVQFLERNFELENKLEPERKVQLAKELGLHPRQVAIWFQNRRARFKTKQIERDYGALKSSFDTLKAEYDNLLQENLKLKEEVNCLKSRLNIAGEKEEENMIDHLGLVSKNIGAESCGNDSSKLELAVMGIMKCQEDANSSAAKSGDSEHSSLVEEEAAEEHSVFSQDEQDNNNNNNNNLMSFQPFLPKVEDDECCNLGFPLEDQPFCFWSY